MKNIKKYYHEGHEDHEDEMPPKNLKNIKKVENVFKFSKNNDYILYKSLFMSF